MKVLNVIPTLGYGGAERLLVSLLPELRSSGIECEVAVLHSPYSLSEELEAAGIKVHCLDLSHRWAIPEAVSKLTRILRNDAYDAMWGHLYFGNLYACLSSVFFPHLRTVMTLHSPGYALTPPVTRWESFRIYLEQKVVEHLADRIVAVSTAVAKDFQQVFGWRNIEVIHNGVPTSLLPKQLEPGQRQQVRQKYGVNDNHFLVIVPARYVPHKGHLILLEALMILSKEKNWTPYCIAVGSGNFKAEIQTRLLETGLADTMILHDSMSQSQLFELILASDMVVLPSLREPFGIAAAESMAMGIPTIVSDVDGFRELIGESRGALMVTPSDPGSLADALWLACSNPAIRTSTSALGKQRIKEYFDVSVVAQKWAGILFRSSDEVTAHCPICGGSGRKKAFPYETYWNNKLFNYMRCDSCKTAFVDPKPDSNDFSTMYSKTNYHDVHYNKLSLEPYIRSIQSVSHYLADRKTLLDFGCGTGNFLIAADEAGFVCCGIEYDHDAIVHASNNSGVPVLSLSALRDSGKTFDIIHLGDVIEHLPNPAETLIELEQFLAPNGVFFVEGPLQANPSFVYWCAAYSKFILRWISKSIPGKQAPTHLFLTNGIAQRSFFTDRLGYTCLYYEVRETGWPYFKKAETNIKWKLVNSIKHAIAVTAIALSKLNSRFGNRFSGVFKP